MEPCAWGTDSSDLNGIGVPAVLVFDGNGSKFIGLCSTSDVQQRWTYLGHAAIAVDIPAKV